MKKLLNFTLPILLVPLLNGCSSLYTYEDSEKYISSSDFEINSKIEEIELNWINGNVNLFQNENETISINETNQGNYPLYYYLDETTLKIAFVKSGTNQSVFNTLNKEINIYLPSYLIDLDFDIVNGSVKSNSNISTKEMDVDIVNGNIEVNQVNASLLDWATVNGSIKIETLNAPKLEIEKVNGDSTINNILAKTYINIDSVNSSDKITVPSSLGYKVSYEAIGSFTSDYDNAKNYGNEEVEIKYNAVNGSLKILKLD